MTTAMITLVCIYVFLYRFGDMLYDMAETTTPTTQARTTHSTATHSQDSQSPT